MYRFSRRLCQAFISSCYSHENRHVLASCGRLLEITFNHPSTGNLIPTLYFSNISNWEKDTAKNMENKIITYEDLKKKIRSVPRTLIIDVREPYEFENTGRIPESINIRTDDVCDEFEKTEEQFINKYAKFKPATNTEIILSCHSGKRSECIQNELQKRGYTNVLNFSGGWEEWDKKQKEEKEQEKQKAEQQKKSK